MPDLVETPNGWVERYPTHCKTGHRFAAHKVIVGWTGTARYFYCLHPDHVLEAERWNVPSGGAPLWEGMASDGEIVRARNGEA